MTELPDRHDRQSMERLHQHLARAERELQDAQQFLAPGSAAAAERDIVRAVAAGRLSVEIALERVRSRLGENEA